MFPHNFLAVQNKIVYNILLGFNFKTIVQIKKRHLGVNCTPKVRVQNLTLWGYYPNVSLDLLNCALAFNFPSPRHDPAP